MQPPTRFVHTVSQRNSSSSYLGITNLHNQGTSVKIAEKLTSTMVKSIIPKSVCYDNGTNIIKNEVMNDDNFKHQDSNIWILKSTLHVEGGLVWIVIIIGSRNPVEYVQFPMISS